MNLRAGAAQAPAPGEFIDQPARHAAAGLPAPMPPQPAGYRLGAAVRHGIRRAPMLRIVAARHIISVIASTAKRSGERCALKEEIASLRSQ